MLDDLLVDTVDILTLVIPVGQDKGGGQILTYTPGATGVACSVRPDKSNRNEDHSKQSSEVPVTIYFDDDPGVHLRDQLVWKTKDGYDNSYVDAKGNTVYPIIALDGRSTDAPRRRGPFKVTGMIRSLR
jgi:hypothetical protein